jgi:hypothetical protein
MRYTVLFIIYLSITIPLNGMNNCKQLEPSQYHLARATQDYTIFTRIDGQTKLFPYALITLNALPGDRKITVNDLEKFFNYSYLNPHNRIWNSNFFTYLRRCKSLTDPEALRKFQHNVLLDQQSKLLAVRYRKKNEYTIPESPHANSLRNLIMKSKLPNPLIIEHLNENING